MWRQGRFGSAMPHGLTDAHLMYRSPFLPFAGVAKRGVPGSESCSSSASPMLGLATCK